MSADSDVKIDLNFSPAKDLYIDSKLKGEKKMLNIQIPPELNETVVVRCVLPAWDLNWKS